MKSVPKGGEIACLRYCISCIWNKSSNLLGVKVGINEVVPFVLALWVHGSQS